MMVLFMNNYFASCKLVHVYILLLNTFYISMLCFCLYIPSILYSVFCSRYFFQTIFWVINSFFQLFSSVQFSCSVCPALCDPVNRSTPGLPVHHQLPEFTQTHVHRVGDAVQTISSSVIPFSSCPNPSQHQSLFQ